MFALGRVENLSFVIQCWLLDFTGLGLWVPFNFPQSTALLYIVVSDTLLQRVQVLKSKSSRKCEIQRRYKLRAC